MLYIIGIGLNDEKDITVKGLEAIKKCDFVYLEHYTSKLNCDIASLEKIYGKKIILADRALVENSDEIIKNAEKKNVAFLVIGDALSATTHVNFILEAKKKGIKFEIINNASVLTAVGITGLQLYNFGKTTSIPFKNENVTAPVEVLEQNQKQGLHTLMLLDLDPKNDKFMTINEAIKFLLKNKVDKKTKVIACCALGSDNAIIKLGSLESLEKVKFNKFPQCLVIPGKMHFLEEEMLEIFK